MMGTGYPFPNGGGSHGDVSKPLINLVKPMNPIKCLRFFFGVFCVFIVVYHMTILEG